MSQNRFEQVDERQEDAITLFLVRRGEAATGFLTCPMAISGGRFTQDQVGTEGPAKDAFRSAVALANDIKAAVVVVDPDDVWQAEWGTLYRET